MKPKKIVNKKINTIYYKICSDERIIIEVIFYFYQKNSKNLSQLKIPMIVDTGANTTVLNIKFAENIGFELDNRRTPKVEITTASEEKAMAYKYIVPEVMLEDSDNAVIFIKNLEILTYAMPVIPQEFGGILGLDFFKDKKICLDLLNQTLDVT